MISEQIVPTGHARQLWLSRSRLWHSWGVYWEPMGAETYWGGSGRPELDVACDTGRW